jgi:cell division protease FtsH
MSLGGRAAEMIVFGTMTNGAADDLKRSAQVARQMVSMWGMGANMANIALGEGDRDVFLGEQISRQRSYSEATAREIDEEVIAILREAYDRAVAILTEHREALDKLVSMLLEEEQVDGERVKSLVNGADAH